MGAGNFDVTAYKKQATEAKVSTNSGFTATRICNEFDPAKVSMRFSKKGPFNSFRDVITVLIGLDVTGSMGMIPKSLLQGKLGSLMVDLKTTYNKPNENLQISFAGIGDAETDEAPLQVTHFESDNRFAQQLQKIWLEGGGGANEAESYNLLWWYAANKTTLNYIKQDARKGILITIGDEPVHPGLTAGEIQMCLDPNYDGGDISNEVLLRAAREQYEVYHIIITDGNAYKYATEKKQEDQTKQWVDLLGQKNIIHTHSEDVANAIADIVKRHRPQQQIDKENLTAQEWEHQVKQNLTDQQWQEVLNYTVCPLTGKFMANPVELGNTKRVYEKEAIQKYIGEWQRDPLTQASLSSADIVLRPNLNIAQQCLSYKPYFEALPESRKEHLIQITQQAQPPVEPIKAEVISNNPHSMFASTESEQGMRKRERMELSLTCPILHEIMQDPVMLIATGQTYERQAIERWLSTNNTDPLTGKQLKDKTLVPNYALKSLCEQARSAQSLTI